AARAKYLNGPQTALFDKGRTLYGLTAARRTLAAAGGAGGALVVVEGYFDVIACARAGLAACAPMGTALTLEQLRLLWRLTPEPVLALDAGAPGRRAEARALDLALPALAPGRSLRLARLAGGKDPDDIFRDQGPEALAAALARSVPFVEALFARE